MSVYRVTEVIGVSDESWEAAARNAVETAAGTVRELRIAEVVRQDVTIENGRITAYRVRLALSFKYDVDRQLNSRSGLEACMSEFVNVQVTDGVATIRLDRPPMNAISVPGAG